MISDTSFQVIHTFAAGASYSYLTVPYRCTLRDVITTLQADPGDNETLTFTENSAGTALGVVTFGSDVSAGDNGTWVSDTTTGDHVLAAGEVIKITGSVAAAANALIDIELDIYARTA